MSRGGALRWAARRLPGVDDRLRADLVASADELAASDSRRFDRALEVASLVGFAFRSASRRGAGDDRRELVRQGVRVGALVLAVVAAMTAWSAAWLAPPAGVPAAVTTASLATLVAVAVAGGLRAGAVVFAALHVAVVGVAVVAGGPALAAGRGGASPALPVLVLAAVAWGRRFDARACPAGAALAGAGIVAAGAAGGLAPATAAGLVGAAGIAVPVVLLVIGWFDPRYAVAATLVWLWRLVAIDLGELSAAVEALADELSFRLLLARWLLMALGMVLAWHVSSAAIRRCLTVFRA